MAKKKQIQINLKKNTKIITTKKQLTELKATTNY